MGEVGQSLFGKRPNRGGDNFNGASPINSLMRNVIIPLIAKLFVLSLKMQTFDIFGRLANCESASQYFASATTE